MQPAASDASFRFSGCRKLHMPTRNFGTLNRFWARRTLASKERISIFRIWIKGHFVSVRQAIISWPARWNACKYRFWRSEQPSLLIRFVVILFMAALLCAMDSHGRRYCCQSSWCDAYPRKIGLKESRATRVWIRYALKLPALTLAFNHRIATRG